MSIKYILQGSLSGLSIAALAMVTGCGGGGGDGGGGGGGTPVAQRTGILTDSPVAGVAYVTTPSRHAGVTGANGSYNFNPGDTVEFRLGGLVLGNVPATGIVTPTELAAGNSNKLNNLLVVLQSLDGNGNPADGISIPASAAAAVTTEIDLTVAPASLNTTALQAAMNAGGISTPPVTLSDARAHYLAQGMTLLSSNIWLGQPADSPVTNSTIFLRFAANGEYLHGQAQAPEAGDSGMTGVEYGTATLTDFDEYGYTIPTPTITVDTNGQWGMSHPLFCDRWRSVGDEIIFTEDRTTPTTCETSTVLDTTDKAENNAAGIVGVWALGSATTIYTVHFVFFSDGQILLVDPLGDTDPSPCGGPGVESGTYSYDAAARILRVSTLAFDTNGCAGLSESGAMTPAGLSFSLSGDGSTATVVDGADTYTVYRVSN